MKAKAHQEATGAETKTRNAKMAELAKKKKSYLDEKQKFDKLKQDLDAVLSATRVTYTKGRRWLLSWLDLYFKQNEQP